MNPQRKRIGIIGGLGALGAADIFFKLVQATPSASGRDQYDLMFEQRPFDEPEAAGSDEASLTARKLYVFDMVRHFEARQADAVLLPCFISHTFLDEIAGEVRVPLLDMRDALVSHVQRRHPEARRIGVLTSDRVRRHRLFEIAFERAGLAVIQPAPDLQRTALMPAIYGANGIKSGHLQGEAIDLLEAACRSLLDQGAELIVPGFTEIPIVIEALRERGLPIVDSNRVYAGHAVTDAGNTKARPFKVGVVGGVGPAATADFMRKIVLNTTAARDQDHIKIVVEQNPQIPDRTANLIGDGPDPTVALYATCKKLEAGDADLIAIPCNTAHAFVERIQPYLSIPIVNMLHETVRHLREHHPGCRRVGLLATSGTLGSRVYHEAVEGAGLEAIAPDEANQARVMNAIYGEKGVKAGYTEGECRDDLMLALAHLVERGAQAVILGCTELPLLLAQSAAFPVARTHVVLLDPTDILARKCVALAHGDSP
ncbi:amino acid racemase [Variovorax robiniae]|uniref:Amino acid racemase n=1 Tax=Variovorax robiniae TaxID=1836199 RepID=A0ABU8X940_9BURK